MGEDQLRQLKRIPQLLRFIPGTAQDVRAYYLVLQYWLSGSADNLEGMLRFVLRRYGTARQPFKRAEPPAPRSIPRPGCIIPDLPQRVVEHVDDLPARGDGPRVGLLLTRSYVLAENTAHYDAVIRALEARGLAPVPAFTAGLDGRPAIARYFTCRTGSATIEAMVALTGFSLVAGPPTTTSRPLRATLERWMCRTGCCSRSSCRRWRSGVTTRVASCRCRPRCRSRSPSSRAPPSPLVFGGSRGADGGARWRSRSGSSASPIASQAWWPCGAPRAPSATRGDALRLPAERWQCRHRSVPRGLRILLARC
jgi:hypothetical protein